MFILTKTLCNSYTIYLVYFYYYYYYLQLCCHPVAMFNLHVYNFLNCY
jgi:hypothetical protein